MVQIGDNNEATLYFQSGFNADVQICYRLSNGTITTQQIATKSDFVKVGNVDTNGNISINEISSSRKIISISRSGFIIIPFVYADYWVAHCFNLDMTPVAVGVQLELNITYILL